MASPPGHHAAIHPAPARLAVLISGGGRTLANLLQHIDAGGLDASVVLVIASKECPGAQRARERGIPTQVVPGVIPAETLASLLEQHRADLVVLAGYLKLVNIPRGYEGRVVNIHPALLPDFGGPGMYGQRVHEAVLRSGVTLSGCTVHLCDEVYDRGTILLQKTCPILPTDTPETLAARVFELERQAYPEALQNLITARRAGVR